jgi:hypothetical protein
MRRPADHDQVITTDMLIGCAGHRDHLNRVRRAKATGDRVRNLVGVSVHRLIDDESAHSGTFFGQGKARGCSRTLCLNSTSIWLLSIPAHWRKSRLRGPKVLTDR